MQTDNSTAFSFEGFKIKRFSIEEPDDSEGFISLDFNPSGKYFPQTGVFEIYMDFSALMSKTQEDSDVGIPIVKCHYISTFQFQEPVEFNKLPDYFYRNSIAIAFPYLRAFISTLTLQANLKIMVLPLMNLRDLETSLRKHTEIVSG